MKKLFLLSLLSISLTGISQEQKIWRLGVQFGFHGNPVKYEGGMTEAHARFNSNKFEGGGFGIVARYDYNHHWMLTTGLGFNSIGFNYAIAENYSLLNKNRNYSSVRSEFTVLEIPLMVFYKFNLNCNNARWLIGAGLTENFIGVQSASGSVSKSNDGPSGVNYLSANSSVNGGNYILLRWAIAREKLYKRGSILNASIVCNIGFDAIAHSTVNYTLDNSEYTHNFSNNGSFVGFRLAYYFRPFNNPWKERATKKVSSHSSIN